MTEAIGRDQTLALLESPNEELRLEGVRRLGGSGDGVPPDLDLLFKSCGDPSWRVRKEAADLFLQLPERWRLAGDVVALLQSGENAGLRNAAVDILVRMGHEAVPALLERVRDPDHDVRKFIIDILGEIGDRSVVTQLREALGDVDENVRAAAAENLGKLRASEAVPALLDAMRHPDVLLRFTILDALARIGAPVPLERLLPFRDEQLLRKALIDCLGKVGDAASVAEVLTGLSDPMRNVRESSLLALVDLMARYPVMPVRFSAGTDPAAAIETVRAYLGDETPLSLRKAAVRVLGWLDAEAAVAPLLERLGDEMLQQETLTALIDIFRRHPQTVGRAWEQASPLQRAYLAYVFGEAGCDQSVPQLSGALLSSDSRLVQMAAQALGRLGGAGELAPLAGCLRHADVSVREAAARSLAILGERFPELLLAVLEPLLEDGNPVRRSAAVGILGCLKGEGVSRHLAMALKDPEAVVRRMALKALSGPAIAENLLAIQLSLTDEDVDVRRAAAELLGASGDPEAVHGLRLALRDEDIWVRAAAVRSLGRLGGAVEMEAVAPLLDDPVGLVSIAVLETLGEVLGEQACPLLLPALAHPDAEVVNVALDLLSRHATAVWLTANAEALANHPSGIVRGRSALLLAVLAGESVRPVLERRLVVEAETAVRQQLAEALAELAGF